MFLNRSFHLLSVKLSRISSSRNWQLKVAIIALTLPVFFSTVSEAQVSEIIKARESEAKQYVSSMNKAQQAYYAENAVFTSSFSNLGIGIKPETANYKYSISTGNQAVFNYAVSKQANLKSSVGGVFVIGKTIKAIWCQANAAGTTKPANPTNKNGVLACGANTAEATRLPQTVKASESEGKHYVSSMNKSQIAYYAENTGFTNSVANLDINMNAETANYKYSISTENKAVFNYGVAKQANIKSFVGGVFIVGNTLNFKTILCLTNAASTTKPANPTNKNGTLACGANTTQVTP